MEIVLKILGFSVPYQMMEISSQLEHLDDNNGNQSGSVEVHQYSGSGLLGPY